MPLDSVFLSGLTAELSEKVVGAKSIRFSNRSAI